MAEHDIVKRLRDLGDHASFEPHMHHAAADHIDDLRRQIQDLQQQVNYWIASSKHWEKMCEQAHARVMQLDPAFDRVFTTSPEKARALRDAVENWQDGD